MKIMILYGSAYGTARRYAEFLARETGMRAMEYKEVKSLGEYDGVLYIGGLYAGRVLGLSRTMRKFGKDINKMWGIVTVGLTDPLEEQNVRNIRNVLCRQIPSWVYESAAFFHLRGGIDYSKLHWNHKAMMGFLRSQMKKLPQEKQTAETKAFLASYGEKVDFFDPEALQNIAAYIRQNG